jgi:hypothetical protein
MPKNENLNQFIKEQMKLSDDTKAKCLKLEAKLDEAIKQRKHFEDEFSRINGNLAIVHLQYDRQRRDLIRENNSLQDEIRMMRAENYIAEESTLP